VLEPPVATVHGAAQFLNTHLGHDVGPVELVGEGEWSRCFGFRDGERDLVIRFGHHLEDFERDRRAATFASPALPVPEVVEIGAALDGWFAISTRVHGLALEVLDRAAWSAALPAIREVLEALRAIDVSTTDGFGAWDATGDAPYATWRDFLLAVDEDGPAHRSAGWRQRLADSCVGDQAYEEGLARLRELTDGVVPDRRVVHGDLLNRNVLVERDRITGVFDWGCSIYGDPVYEVALMMFWDPWHPTIDVEPLLDLAGDDDARLRACLIHVGLQHQGYCAFLGRDDDLRKITAQTNALL
jgi:hygromycin-B 4-O-kinase